MARKEQTTSDLKPARPRRILIAGGAGFLGSHLAERLVREGHEIICVDNLQTGRLRNLAPLMREPSFSFLRHDIGQPLPVEGALDEVWNLACAASPPLYQLDPLHTFRTCIHGSLNLLELAREKGARIFQASTSEVYGDPEISPQSESYRGSVNTWGPRACYDEGKRAAETLFFEYERMGVEVRVARIFNTYGPRMSPEDGRVVSSFVCQALAGEALQMNGDGSQTRSFCYVDDLIEGLCRLMASDAKGPVNIGNPDEFTVRELADMVLEMTGSNSSIGHNPMPQDDPRQRRPDITRAGAELGWQPTIPLRDGLTRTIAHFREALAQGKRKEARVG
ncbi:MAG TPA: UDP-glucuronic acid decarboxylase family protein [Rubellimicrobium sp.]|nr:UDP-glucuronic acid decarboxylase family protein [Rubellimicrobium sp.]